MLRNLSLLVTCMLSAPGFAARSMDFQQDILLLTAAVNIDVVGSLNIRNISSATQTIALASGGIYQLSGGATSRAAWGGTCQINCTVVSGGKFQLTSGGLVTFGFDTGGSAPGGYYIAMGRITIDESGGYVIASGSLIADCPSQLAYDRTINIVVSASKPF